MSKVHRKLYVLITCMLFTQLVFSQTYDDLVEMTLEELLNIEVITASAKSVKIVDAPANIFVITGTEMEKRGYRTLTDVFPDLPGTIVINREPSKTILPIIRGHHGNNRFKIMINGMELNTKSGLLFSFGVGKIPVALIKRVEFIAGAYSALYGRNSFTGVLNIITKDGADVQGFIADVSFEAPYNHIKTEAVIGNKIGKIDFLMSLYMNSSNKGRDLAEEYPEKYSLQAREQALLDKGEGNTLHGDAPTDFYLPWHNEFMYLRLKHDNGLFAEFNYNASNMPKVSERFNPLLYYQNKDTQMDKNTTNVSVGYGYNNNKIKSRTLINGQYHDYIGVNGYVQTNMKKIYADRSLGAKIEQQFHYKLYKWNEVFLKLSYEQVEIYSTKVSKVQFNPKRPEWADNEIHYHKFLVFSLHDEVRIGEKFILSAGILYEKSNSHKDIFLPRFSSVWKISETSYAKFIYSSGFLSVDPLTVVDVIIPGGKSTMGKDNLEPELLTEHELVYQKQIKENFALTASAYYSTISNVSVQYPDASLPAPFTYTWKNRAGRTAYGGELMFRAHFMQNSNVFGSYGFVDGYEELENEVGTKEKIDKLTVTANHHFKIGLNISFWQNKLNLYIHNVYIHDFEKIFIDTYDKHPGYNLLDFNLMTSPNLFKNINFAFQVKNVFDTKTYDPQFWPQSYNAPSPIPRRSFNINIRYRFKQGTET